ncbi:class I SAM-dependent methyltransferase [Macrococcus caseolyticus]|uniref:class I SAM-dependent methyltransferase n=1 Tax=Macrococcoides caseolyticum TaxID=69966 RepID=UPI0024BC23CC|nr:class I SAM-dependent methyltransferase [Macrococcus caseolyticus]MDJ1110515.1 class I SAM-dependent methyltransferase [Macrococcus caseolyticus]
MGINFELLKISKKYGNIYGSELIAQQLYVLIKREKLINVIELGTGLGVTSVWIGTALKENEKGLLNTFDNFEHSGELQRLGIQQELVIYNNISKLKLNDVIKMNKMNINLDDEKFQENFSEMDNIDLIFSDFSHGISDIQNIFRTFLPYLGDKMHIFIDSVPSNLEAKYYLNQLIEDFNNSKIASFIYKQTDKEMIWQSIQNILCSKFTIHHIEEKDTTHQGATTWIIIEKI